ncbi:heparan-alpha-glucosaminide N-acetyltransferase domain-containing protein [Aquimarina sp. 2201CG1-2-11]|uniref:heparan-alpha-glucosaminide N-acetyltransferase domain-containing protein n=1 Tax=Aquimarina discodermiae TaxID=3231043 RepID=UPI003463060F
MRVASIDILRAVTMVLMIWVNDFWTLTDVPKWLTHAAAHENYLGFSDIIFPLFLFIVGLSIPHAIGHRIAKKEPTSKIARHIIIRSFSLIIIGVFMVNYGTAHHQSIIIGKYFWGLLMAFAIALVWMNWKKTPLPKKWHPYFKIIGIGIFIFLAVIYKGGAEGTDWMKTQWWGILGLIGWAYFINALLYLYSRKNSITIGIIWIILIVLSVLYQTNLIVFKSEIITSFSVLYTGTIPAFTTAGILASLLHIKLSKTKLPWFYAPLIVLGIINIAFGMITRSFWGISKIQETPSWLAICTGIGFLLFSMLHFIADVKKQVKWAAIIAPAGTATLTCYMIPYFLYPIWVLTGIKLPDALNASIIGLLISFGFALLVVVFTGWLEKKGYTLKL